MPLNNGSGSFVWQDNTGISNPNKPLTVYYYRPEVVNANTPVWIIMHGDSRNPSDYRNYFVDAATKQGAIVIAPEFTEADWPGSRSYNVGNIAISDTNPTPRPVQEWSFSKIEPLFDYVKQLEPTLTTNEYFMYGHSAGAQFVHRYLEWIPNARVKLAVSANAGWYTVPDTNGSYNYSWPYSTINTPDYNPATPAYDPFPVDNLKNFFGDKMVVLLGDRDLLRTSSLRQTPEADAQGQNRFERGQFFFNEIQAEAAALNTPLNIEKQIVPGIDHDGQGMAVPAAELFRLANLPSIPTQIIEPEWFFSVRDRADLSGTTIENEDIVRVDANGNFSVYFDGSNVGLDALAIDAFDVISNTEILISFTEPGVIAGINVDDSDIVKFTATELGPNTTGTFELYFHGSDVRLDADAQDIDAVSQLSDGTLLISTLGDNSVPGIGAENADVLRFVPTSTGNLTTGTWGMYFDASDVGLTPAGVDAVSVTRDGKIYLSTSSDFSTRGAAITGEDVFAFTPSSIGENTSGTIDLSSILDLGLYGLANNNIQGLDVSEWNLPTLTPPTPTQPATVEYYRFKNTTFSTGTYLFVGAQERDAILANPDFNQTFELEGGGNAAFLASAEPGNGLEPFYRLLSLDVPGTYLFVGTEEYNAIFAPTSDQKDKWVKEGFDASGVDIAEFYLYGVNANQGTIFNRLQNNDNNTYLFAGPQETQAILADPNFSNAFTNQGVAFEALI